MLDDSTTTPHLVPHLHSLKPLTVIANNLTIMNELRSVSRITLLGVGGQYHHWCGSYTGRITTTALRADELVMSTSAIVDDIAFPQTLETVDVKRAMFDSASTRILLADHNKFDVRATHATLPLQISMRSSWMPRPPASASQTCDRRGINVIVARRGAAAR